MKGSVGQLSPPVRKRRYSLSLIEHHAILPIHSIITGLRRRRINNKAVYSLEEK